MKTKAKELSEIKAKDFMIFKSGIWNGETFTESDLDEMVKNYNADEPPHIILGHSSDYKGKTMIPSFGRVLGGLKRIGNALYAQGAMFNDSMAKWIQEGFFNQRSIELTKDNKRILAIGMLGAMPPAVKGMPLMQEALAGLSFSEFSETKTIEFADAPNISMTDEMEKLAVADTFKNLSEDCGIFLTKIELILGTEDATAEALMNEVWALQAELCNELNLHSKFIEKIEQIEESTEGEMSEKIGWKEFKETIKKLFNNRKAKEMEAQKEKEYQEKIDTLEKQVKEFSAKEAEEKEQIRLANEAKAKVEADAKDETLKTEIKNFCDIAIKENKMTPAMRETDEKIMFTLGKTNTEALKSFQLKYSSSVVPLGEMETLNKNESDKRSHIVQQADKYVKAHPKEFSGLSAEDAINRAIYFSVINKIKFENK